MSFGFVLHARNREYQRIAYALALSLKISQKNANVTILTDTTPEKSDIYDQVILLDPSDDVSRVCVRDKPQIYFRSPYDETVHIESDCLVLDNLSDWWDSFRDSETLKYCKNIKDIQNNILDDVPGHRHSYKIHNLPSDIRDLVFWFKKDKKNDLFFSKMYDVIDNYSYYAQKYMPNNPKYQIGFTTVTTFTAMELNDVNRIKDHFGIMSFCHAKDYILGYDWRDKPLILTDSAKLYIDGNKQTGIFHYFYKEWMDHEKIQILEDKFSNGGFTYNKKCVKM